MEEDAYQAGEGGGDAGLPRYGFRVISQFLKDLSFENVDPPAELHQPEEVPHGVIQVDIKVSRVSQEAIDVGVHLRVEATVKGVPAYIAELEYWGRFTFLDLPDPILEMLAMVEAPRLLFPFMRVIVANVTRDGGYPALILNPIDFAGLYRSMRARQEPAAQNMEGTF
jgi:preprotein translocase subunit SecB